MEPAALEALPHEDVRDPQLRRGHPRIDVVRQVEGLPRVLPDLLEELDALLVVLGVEGGVGVAEELRGAGVRFITVPKTVPKIVPKNVPNSLTVQNPIF